jgi:hypothetical protein
MKIQSKIKRAPALLLSLALVFALLPAARTSAGSPAPTSALTLNSATRTVGFAGQEWYVIGYDGTGVYSQEGTATLLVLVRGEKPYGLTAFNNTSGSDYSESTLQTKISEIASSFSEKESALINARTLTAEHDDMSGASATDQKLWPLSVDEVDNISSNGGDAETIRGTGPTVYWWTRTGHDASEAWRVSNGGTQIWNGSITDTTIAARPAFNLDLGSVLFMSAVSGSESAVGSLAAAAESTSAVKFTAVDASLTLTVEPPDDDAPLTFTYSGAATGDDRYVSCILEQDGGVKYYGKLAELNSAGAAAGTFTVPISGVGDGTYTLKIFSEEINTGNYTNFCSAPVPMTLTVSDGSGQISNFNGESDSTLPPGSGPYTNSTPTPTPEAEDETDIIDEGPALAEFAPDRVAYIHGYPDGTVRPDGNLSRAEVAVMLWRLLSDAEKDDPTAATFTDVADDAWYAREVSYLADSGIILGYEDGTFKPDKKITRAEFTVILSRFFDMNESAPASGFDDAAGHWAENYINNAVAKDWIAGYPDGTFRPDAQITRAQAATMINKMLGLTLDAIPDDVPVFSDLSEDHWAYTDIMIATYEPTENDTPADEGTDEPADENTEDINP